ncbi:MAG: fumarate hydratase C-terminal domain-containing protein [Deltaproteobacteria bacterium]|nr:fumarate hydratase C-terminal domain-containing protein [Deltaproteobacteria bacterium]
MSDIVTLKLPLGRDPEALKVLRSLESGMETELEGVLIAARDQAHRRLVDMLEEGRELPFDPEGQALYYMGPSPAAPGRVIGAAGPTTAGRMDPFTLPLLEKGVKFFVGKGRRAPYVKEALLRHGALYLAAVGGAGAFYSLKIVKQETLAFPELGPEALLRLEVRGFPAVVIHDLKGGDWYESSPAKYRSQA